MTARRPSGERAAKLAERPPDTTLPDQARLSPASDRAERFLAALSKYPKFRELWLGMVAASVGQWMQQIALGWLALVITNSPSFVGIVAFAAGIPFIVVGPPAGNLIDRVDRRRLLLACQLFAAGLAGLVAILVLAGFVRPWHLPLAAFLNGCLLSIMTPTQQSLVPLLVDRRHLTNAIALMSAGQHVTRIVGPSVAGILIAWWGVGPAFAAQAVMLLVSVYLISRISLPARATPKSNGAGRFNGLRVIWSSPALRPLFLMAATIAFFVFPYLGFVNVFARDVLKIGATGLGVLMAASGAGAVTGALFVAARARSTGVGRPLILVAVVYGFVILGVSISRSPFVSAGLMFCGSFLGAMIVSLNTALVQHRIQDDVRGRVMSAYFLTSGLMPLGALPMGVVADHFGVRIAVGASAVISSLLVGLLGLTSRELRDL